MKSVKGMREGVRRREEVCARAGQETLSGNPKGETSRGREGRRRKERTRREKAKEGGGEETRRNKKKQQTKSGREREGEPKKKQEEEKKREERKGECQKVRQTDVLEGLPLMYEVRVDQ